MPNIPSQKELLTANPHLDAKEARKASELTKQLRQQGVRVSEYELSSPFTRRKTFVRSQVGRARPIRSSIR